MVYNIEGCIADTSKVFYNPLSLTKFPNVITPNNDGKNEVLFFEGITGHENSKLTVVNRWGKVIYQASGYANNWNCHDCPPGIYYYRLQVGECLDYKGWLHILK